MSSEAHEPCAIYINYSGIPVAPWACWKCRVCDRYFGIHEDDKPVSCPVCGVHFTQRLHGTEYEVVT